MDDHRSAVLTAPYLKADPPIGIVKSYGTR